MTSNINYFSCQLTVTAYLCTHEQIKRLCHTRSQSQNVKQGIGMYQFLSPWHEPGHQAPPNKIQSKQ